MKRYFILLFLSFQAMIAQVQFEAKVSKQTLGLNERLRIDFTMNDDGDNFTPPNFEGFKIVAGPSQQVSQSWINGKSSFNKIIIILKFCTVFCCNPNNLNKGCTDMQKYTEILPKKSLGWPSFPKKP